jgi:hypothetical protein
MSKLLREDVICHCIAVALKMAEERRRKSPPNHSRERRKRKKRQKRKRKSRVVTSAQNQAYILLKGSNILAL